MAKIMNGRNKLLILAVFAIAAGLFWLFGPGGMFGEFGGGKKSASAVKGVDADNPALVARGQKVYAEACASCHGADLKGQKDWRRPNPDGTLKAPPHDETGHTWHHPDRAMFDYIRRGGQAIAPAGFKSAMPGFGRGFGGAYSDADIWAVLSFIHSRWPARVRERQRQIDGRSRPD